MPANIRILDDLQVIRHEYVHVLTKHQLLRYPKWYEEGIAEVLSYIKVKENTVELGLPAKERLYGFQSAASWGGARLLSFDEVVAGDYAGGSAVFADPYLQFWFLAHYLTFGNTEFRPQLEKCLIYSDGGMAPLAAFRLAFGTSPEALWDERISKDYRRQVQTLVYRFNAPLVGVPFTASPANATEVRAILEALKADAAARRKNREKD